MMLSALKGVGVVELQRELAALDPAPHVMDNHGKSDSSSSSAD